MKRIIKKIKENNNGQRGITLVALVITIVILIILAVVTINAIFGENGLINQANKAKELHEIGEWKQRLELEKAEVALKNLGEVTIEEYIEHIKEKGIIEDKDIEEIDEDSKYITVEDKYVFLLEEKDNKDVEITYMGKPDGMPPRITNIEMTNTTNSIEVKVEGERLEGGKYTYYIKETSEGEYEEKGKNEEGTFTYTGLTQNKIYYIKVEVETENGTDSIEGNKTTNTLENLTEANTKFTITPEGWTNGKVETTVEVSVSGYNIEYSKDLNTWEKYEGKIESEKNESIYVRITDGNNVGGHIEKKIENIDKEVPREAGIALEGAGTSTNIPELGATVTLTDGESGVDIGKSKWIINNTGTAIGTNPDSYTGTFTSNNEKIKTQLGGEGSYYIHVLTKDNAGNYKETISTVANVIANIHQHSGSASTGGGCYTTPVYHQHSGSSSTGGGCYTTPVYHAHVSGCYQNATCTVRCIGLTPGQKNDNWIEHPDSRFEHSSCGRGIAYQTPKHLDGEGCNCGDTTTHTYSQLVCGKNESTVESYSLGCGKTAGSTIDSYTIGCGIQENQIVSYTLSY